VFKSTGVGKTILDWDIAGDSVVPASAFQWSSSLSVAVSPTEGTTDYTTSSTSFTSNAINFKVTFPRVILAEQTKKFTLESQ
jgi:hypothetical protein